MIRPKILLTGATGGVGMPLAARLVDQGYAVRALVRQSDARSHTLERMGVELAFGDLYDPDQLFVAFAVAAKEARLEHVVQMSQWTSHRAHPALMTRQTWLVDRSFAMIPGVAHTVFNPGMFAHNFLRTIDFAALLGVFPVLSGDGRAAPVSNEDMARVVAQILIEGPQRHSGKSYRPTGPKLLDGREMAAAVANVLGRSVRAVDMPIWLLGKVARQQGIDPYEITSLRHYMQDMRQGTFAFEGGVTDVVAQITGAPAESFETTARRYAELPFARRTLTNRVSAAINFMLTPLRRGTDFARWDRAMAFPVTPHPSLAIEDAVWRATHLDQMASHATPA